ncbi:MAG: ROK family protein [Elusimicrobia bacterium]|nr:ROK family protein [Elusimicrobiota bacterium]
MKGLGIDIGGTNTKIVVINGRGRLLHEERFHTLGESGGYGDFMNRLTGCVRRLNKIWRPGSVGIGAAGDVDPQKGLIRFSPNLEKWRYAPITGPLNKLTGVPCTLENDANMAAWGAYELELKKKYANVLAVTLGTGIGGGLILDGRLYHGATGSAGEIGHNKIKPGGERCHCGAQGCLEACCGSYAIMRDARKAIKNAGAFVRKYAAPGRERLNTICLTRAADRGHKTALRIWREMGENLGRGLADAILLFNPDCVMLTGGVSRASRHFLGPLKKVFAAQQIKTPFQKVRLRVAKNADLGVFGAALFGMERVNNRQRRR